MLSRLSIAAVENQLAVGLITLEFPYPNNANIYWMVIKPTYHRKGIGKALLDFAAQVVKDKGASSLTVETLDPSEADENYLKTYHFYKACGFQPLFNLKPEGYGYRMVYMGKWIWQIMWK